MRLNWLWSDKVHFFVQMISEWLSPADICFIINPSSPLMRLGFWIKSAVVSHWFEHQLNSLLSSVRARIWLSMIEMSITLFLFFDFLKRMKFELKSKVLNQDEKKTIPAWISRGKIFIFSLWEEKLPQYMSFPSAVNANEDL